MKKTLIIAEAGVNHNGDLHLAEKLIVEAAVAGADYIKFQTFISGLNISKSAQKAEYQINNTQNSTESQLEMVRKLELSFDNFRHLANVCKANNIGFLSTGFDLPSIDFLSDLNIPFFKVPSGEITNIRLLRSIAQKKKPILLSTGMSTMDDIKSALDVFYSFAYSKSDITLLHCTTEYPTPMHDVNLKAMLSMKNIFELEVGYSDHTKGIEVPIAAVALGASVIEKHFTLDRNMSGPDHLASIEPDELKQMVKAIRNIELAIAGSGVKEPSESEIKNISIARKSIVAGKTIKKGEMFTVDNLDTKRPGTGISPMQWDSILGKTAKRDYNEDDQIEL